MDKKQPHPDDQQTPANHLGSIAHPSKNVDEETTNLKKVLNWISPGTVWELIWLYKSSRHITGRHYGNNWCEEMIISSVMKLHNVL